VDCTFICQPFSLRLWCLLFLSQALLLFPCWLPELFPPLRTDDRNTVVANLPRLISSYFFFPLLFSSLPRKPEEEGPHPPSPCSPTTLPPLLRGAKRCRFFFILFANCLFYEKPPPPPPTFFSLSPLRRFFFPTPNCFFAPSGPSALKLLNHCGNFPPQCVPGTLLLVSDAAPPPPSVLHPGPK